MIPDFMAWSRPLFDYDLHICLKLRAVRANHVTSSQSDRSKRVTWLHIKSRRAHFAVRRRQDSSDSRAQEREGHMA